MFEKAAEEYSNNWRINKKANLNFAELVELRAVIYEAHKDGAEFGYNKGKNEAKEIIKDQQELLDRVLSGAETLSDFAQNTLHKAEQFLKDVKNDNRTVS